MLAAATLSVELIFGLMAVGVILGVLLSRWPRACGWACAAVVAGAAGAAAYLANIVFAQGHVEIIAGSITGVPAQLVLHFTPLNVIFLLMILGLGLVATVYSVQYVEKVAAESPGSSMAAVVRYYPALMLFLGSMAAVVSISDLLFFFIAWTLMMLPAFLLIIHDYRKREVMRAGLKFLLFSIVGNLGILLGIIILYRAGGDFSFATARDTMTAFLQVQPWTAHLVFGLLMFGFLTKLGIYPMGDWLPDAHPAAPSPVSALLSGVMIKLGAYDIAHMALELMGRANASSSAMMGWGMALAALGALSVLLGGAAAAANTDTKRLLAFSSVSQSGYILVCLGISMAFIPVSMQMAGLAFVAAMVFVIADGIHKSLLFLTAGSVLHATGTRDLMLLGGLGEKMPATTKAAIVGALSVGGIPLTAGFVGKWLLFQSALQGAAYQPAVAIWLLAIVVGSILSLAYALKYVGATYLGAPGVASSREDVREVPLSMRVPQLVLLLASVAAGLWPSLIVRPAISAWVTTAPVPISGMAGGALMVESVGGTTAGGYIPPVILLLVGVAALLAWGLSRLGGAPVREVRTWQSGLELPLATTRLPASGWYWPFTPVLRSIYREIPMPDVPALYPRPDGAFARGWRRFERTIAGLLP